MHLLMENKSLTVDLVIAIHEVSPLESWTENDEYAILPVLIP